MLDGHQTLIKATPNENIVSRPPPASPRCYRFIWPLTPLFIQLYEYYNFMNVIDHALLHMTIIIIWASLLFFAIIQSDCDYLTFPGLTNECTITVRFREQRLPSHQCGFNRQTLYGTFVLTISNYMIIMMIIVLIMIFIIMANGNRLPACMWSTGSQDRKLCSHLEWPNVPTYLYKINSNI